MEVQILKPKELSYDAHKLMFEAKALKDDIYLIKLLILGSK